MSVHDLEAERKWRQYPKEFQERILNNVFCSTCFTTSIVDYSMYDDDQGILLRGKCKQCGGTVARLVEND